MENFDSREPADEETPFSPRELLVSLGWAIAAVGLGYVLMVLLSLPVQSV
jgi:hypothetical protein